MSRRALTVLGNDPGTTNPALSVVSFVAQRPQVVWTWHGVKADDWRERFAGAVGYAFHNFVIDLAAVEEQAQAFNAKSMKGATQFNSIGAYGCSQLFWGLCLAHGVKVAEIYPQTLKSAMLGKGWRVKVEGETPDRRRGRLKREMVKAVSLLTGTKLNNHEADSVAVSISAQRRHLV